MAATGPERPLPPPFPLPPLPLPRPLVEPALDSISAAFLLEAEALALGLGVLFGAAFGLGALFALILGFVASGFAAGLALGLDFFLEGLVVSSEGQECTGSAITGSETKVLPLARLAFPNPLLNALDAPKTLALLENRLHWDV